MKRLFIALPLLALIAGCGTFVTHTEGTKIEKESVRSIEPGKTTRQQVIDTFGAPAKVTRADGTEKMTYVFKEKQVPSYLGGLIENETRAREESRTLEITVSEGVVRSYRFKSSEE
ncbi:MAG: outer membrane protein assembly factor BamE [Thermodesulfobacteriota bacterium]